jgi:hypothetical protein
VILAVTRRPIRDDVTPAPSLDEVLRKWRKLHIEKLCNIYGFDGEQKKHMQDFIAGNHVEDRQQSGRIILKLISEK